jgi:copper transport protein
VTLVFSEPVTPAGAGIKVFSPSGRQVAGPVATDGPELRSGLAASEGGTYVVSWQVFAADTHPSRGAFAFSVGHSSANPYSALLDIGVAGTSTPLGLALQAIASWVHFAGFALAFGVVAYGALIRGAAAPRRLLTAGLVLLIAAEPLALVAQLASLSFDGDTALAVLGSNFGRLLGLRLGAALLTWALVATGRAWPILVVGGVDAVLDGASAHAIAGLPGAGPLLVAVHISAIGLWVGGVAAFVLDPDRRFTRYALWTLGIAVLSGALLALAHTHFGAVLITTDYGRGLLLKALLVALAALAAAFRRHRPELAVSLLAVGAATVVAALPPPF